MGFGTETPPVDPSEDPPARLLGCFFACATRAARNAGATAAVDARIWPTNLADATLKKFLQTLR